MMKKFLLLVLTLFIGNCVFASSINLKENNGIYHITLNGNSIKKRIQFVSVKNLDTNKNVHINSKSKLTINTGFFDPKNGKTISYIMNDYVVTEDPTQNERFMLNPFLSLHQDKILDRTEFRILECNKKLKYQITQHSTPVDTMCKIKTSAQGGPQLLPDLRLDEEFFILKDKNGNILRQSASVLDKTARTIVGIKDNNLHILIITNSNPKTIFEARDLCKSLGFTSAMAFDGGSSTSLNYKDISVTSIEKHDTGRKLKSFLIVK